MLNQNKLGFLPSNKRGEVIMKRTLVYLGCNEGRGVDRLLQRYSFDTVLLVEGDPISFSVLKDRFGENPNITLVNSCLVPEAGVSSIEFYRTGNFVSSSILALPDDGSAKAYGGLREVVNLPAAFLPEILDNSKIDVVNFLVSDLQGADFLILKSLRRYLMEGRIHEIFIETHKRDNILYKGSRNSFREHRELLKEMYKVNYFSHDGKILGTAEDLVEFFAEDAYEEVDVHWSLRAGRAPEYLWS